MTYDDLNDHPQAILDAIERDDTQADRAWLRWCAVVERRLGHDLDGNQVEDGYSLDYAYEAYQGGMSALDYATEVLRRRPAVHKFS